MLGVGIVGSKEYHQSSAASQLPECSGLATLHKCLCNPLQSLPVSCSAVAVPHGAEDPLRPSPQRQKLLRIELPGLVCHSLLRKAFQTRQVTLTGVSPGNRVSLVLKGVLGTSKPAKTPLSIWKGGVHWGEGTCNRNN